MNNWVLTHSELVNMQHVSHVQMHTKDGIIIALSLYFVPSGQILLKDKYDVQAVLAWFEQFQKIGEQSDRKVGLANSTP